MATYIGLGTDEPSEDSEKRVAEALKKLPSGWVVLHHVSWQSKRTRRQGDGEADFIIFHPDKGMLVIEVKGGGIDIEAGRWFTTNRHGTRRAIKNPYEQAVSSKHALVGWLHDRRLYSRVRVGHAVAFPHMEEVPPVGPAGAPEISFAKPQLDDLENTVDRCFKHWKLEAKMSSDERDEVIAMLAPTISLVPKLAGTSSEAEARIIMLTAEQIESFAGLRASRGGLDPFPRTV